MEPKTKYTFQACLLVSNGTRNQNNTIQLLTSSVDINPKSDTHPGLLTQAKAEVNITFEGW